MRFFQTGAEAIQRLEQVRTALSHVGLLRKDELASLGSANGPTELLTRYHALLEAALARFTAPSIPRQALPVVSVGDFTVTLNVLNNGVPDSVVTVQVGQTNNIRLERPGAAIDPNNGVRTAVAILTNYLGTWKHMARPEGATDPRNAAIIRLSDILGEAEARAVTDAYFPHWPAWWAEGAVAKAEEVVQMLQQQRRHFQEERLYVPPGQTKTLGAILEEWGLDDPQ